MHIILIGCGRVGAGLAHTLNLRGHTLVIIDKDASAFARLGASFQGHMLSGIGFDRDILLQAGIEHADGLAAITNSDEANVVIARLASQVFHVPRVVARLYDPEKPRSIGVWAYKLFPPPYGASTVSLNCFVMHNLLQWPVWVMAPSIWSMSRYHIS